MLESHPHSQLGYDFIGVCFEVHKTLGGGMLEEIYQESLELELGIRQFQFVGKQELAVFYKGNQLKKRYVPDLVIAGELVVELKAAKEIDPEHEAQLFNYLRIARKPVGYLVNFGPLKSMLWRRYVLSEFVTES